MKPRVYVETSVVSYLTAWHGRDLVVAGNQETTREWWERRKDLHTAGITGGLTMPTNPILAELHAIRSEYADRFNQDLHAICVDARRKQGQQGRLVVSPTPKTIVAFQPQQDNQLADVRSAAEHR